MPRAKIVDRSQETGVRGKVSNDTINDATTNEIGLTECQPPQTPPKKPRGKKGTAIPPSMLSPVEVKDRGMDYKNTFTKEQNKILQEIWEKDALVKTYTKEITKLKDIIQKYIGDDFAGLITDLFIVNYRPEEATTFDSATFKKDNPELYAQYQVKAERRKWKLEKK